MVQNRVNVFSITSTTKSKQSLSIYLCRRRATSRSIVQLSITFNKPFTLHAVVANQCYHSDGDGDVVDSRPLSPQKRRKLKDMAHRRWLILPFSFSFSPPPTSSISWEWRRKNDDDKTATTTQHPTSEHPWQQRNQLYGPRTTTGWGSSVMTYWLYCTVYRGVVGGELRCETRSNSGVGEEEMKDLGQTIIVE